MKLRTKQSHSSIPHLKMGRSVSLRYTPLMDSFLCLLPNSPIYKRSPIKEGHNVMDIYVPVMV